MFVFCLIFLVMSGAILGSFAVAQVWRIRARQLKDELDSGQKIDSSEWSKLKPLVDQDSRQDRSRCLHCGYQLRWYDLIPIISWILLRGRCRKCRKSIGWTEFLAEVGLSIVFAAVFAANFDQASFDNLSPILVIRFGLLLVILTIILVLFIYDAKWSLLPSRLMYWLLGLSIIYWLLGFAAIGNIWHDFNSIILNLLISVMIFPAVYWLLAIVSDGVWVGDGDWILALGLIFLLPNQPIYAAMAMFLSNLYGILTIFSLAIFKKTKLQRGVKIAFGPMMILAVLTILIFSRVFMDLTNFLL